jgi:hypothetical protein
MLRSLSRAELTAVCDTCSGVQANWVFGEQLMPVCDTSLGVCGQIRFFGSARILRKCWILHNVYLSVLHSLWLQATHYEWECLVPVPPTLVPSQVYFWFYYMWFSVLATHLMTTQCVASVDQGPPNVGTGTNSRMDPAVGGRGSSPPWPPNP